MEKSSNINYDFIGVITQKNQRVCFEQIPIKHNESFLSLFQNMYENSNQSVLDLQNIFLKEFPQNAVPKFFPYCMPNSFNDSYVNGVEYPNMITYDEYKHQESDCEISKIEEFRSSTKTKFYARAKNYINAYTYNKTLKKILSDPNIRMYSTEIYGWTHFQYKINDDFHINVNTNFGYGSSSYFYLNVRYKDIDILPYSELVNYYKADMSDLIRYTRSYRPIRKHWNVALDFVERTVNFAQDDPISFIKQWIINEIDQMMKGLRLINLHTQYVLEQMTSHPSKDEGLYRSIRNISEGEKSIMKILKDEFTIMFKMEKISGALDFLENMNKLKNIHLQVQDSIDEIKKQNLDLLPELKNAISRIELNLESNKSHLQELEETKKNIENEKDEAKTSYKERNELLTKLINSALIQEFEKNHPEYVSLNKELEKLCVEKSEDEQKKIIAEYEKEHNNYTDLKKDCNLYCTSYSDTAETIKESITKKFCNTHPEYKESEQKINELTQKIDELETKIKDEKRFIHLRGNFKENLLKCKQKIESVIVE